MLASEVGSNWRRSYRVVGASGTYREPSAALETDIHTVSSTRQTHCVRTGSAHLSSSRTMAKQVARLWQAVIEELQRIAQAPTASAPGLDGALWSLLLQLQDSPSTALPRATWKMLVTEKPP